MPTIYRSGRVMIRMFFDDHDPPHFHIVTPDEEMTVALDGLVPLQGDLRKRDYEVAMVWVRANAEILWSKWEELNGVRH